MAMSIDERILEGSGWTLECESPLEIRHDDGSFASGQAARIIIDMIAEEDEVEELGEEGDF